MRKLICALVAVVLLSGCLAKRDSTGGFAVGGVMAASSSMILATDDWNKDKNVEVALASLAVSGVIVSLVSLAVGYFGGER